LERLLPRFTTPFETYEGAWCRASGTARRIHVPSTGMVYSDMFVVIADESCGLLRPAITSSRGLGSLLRSSLEDRLRYTPSDCFETFPFPEDFETTRNLSRPAATTTSSAPRSWSGTTRADEDLQPLPRSQRALARHRPPARVARRDWTGFPRRLRLDRLQPTCDFLLDYVEEEDEERGGRAKKKPYRYRWPTTPRRGPRPPARPHKERAEQERL